MLVVTVIFLSYSVSVISSLRTSRFSLLFLTEKLQAQKIGRELVFSADLWYNGDNEKASPYGRGGGVADGEGK